MDYFGIAMGVVFLAGAVLLLFAVGFNVALFGLLLAGLVGLGSGLNLLEWSKGRSD
jgi:hypothetical protein